MSSDSFSSEDLQHLAFIKALQKLLYENIETRQGMSMKKIIEYEKLKCNIELILDEIKTSDLLRTRLDSRLDTFEKQINYLLKRYYGQISRPWFNDKLTIALMGHMKTGKTSAMNCYFGEKFPTSGVETTALATYLYYGDNPNNTASLADKEGGIQEISSEQMQLFTHEKSFNFPFYRMFSYIAKKSSHPALADKTFIDTPGLFSWNSEHAYTTYKVLDYCDVIFWFIDCRKSISDKEISFIKEYVSNKPIFIIFSFVDARGPRPEHIISAQNVIKQRLAEEGIEIKGYLQFGRREDTQDKFKSEFGKTIKSLNDTYQTMNPLAGILQLLNVLYQDVQDLIKDIEQQLENAEDEIRKFQNCVSISAQQESCATSPTRDAIKNIINIFYDFQSTKYIFVTGDAFSSLSDCINILDLDLKSEEKSLERMNSNYIMNFCNLCAWASELRGYVSHMRLIESHIISIINKKH